MVVISVGDSLQDLRRNFYELLLPLLNKQLTEIIDITEGFN
nr:hypothetical protein [Vibrio vulnificus]